MGLWAEVRRQQTVAELERLEADFRAWDAAATAFDKELKQYSTQLGAVRGLMIGAIEKIREVLPKPDQRLATNADLGAVFQDCRGFDLRTQWLRRIWRFFADKFDQRRAEKVNDSTPPADPDRRRAWQVARFLRAADEVVWSCHRTVLQAAEQVGQEIQLPGGPDAVR